MAVHKRAYKPYDGPLTSERWRFLVLPRYAIQELLESRVIVVYLVLCFVPFLFETGIYLARPGPPRTLLRNRSGRASPDRGGLLPHASRSGCVLVFLSHGSVPAESPRARHRCLPLYLAAVLGGGVTCWARRWC